MRTLVNTEDKQEIIARLRVIHPATPNRWGKMSAHQMICHLNDAFGMYMGLRSVAPVPVPLPRSLLKWVALWAPLSWPKGFKTAPELDQQSGGTAPLVFANDMDALRSSVDRFTRQPKDFQYQAHPHFGPMSEKEWMRLAYLHMDHHLRQFGA